MSTPDLFDDPDNGHTPVLERDRYGRPLLPPPDGGKPKPYTRASTLGKALDDHTGLTNWKCRMVAIGVASRKDLVLAVNAHRDDKKHVGELVEQAMDAAEANAAATTGTALHELCDAYDRGQTPYVPDEYKADVQAYRAATAMLEVVECEVFCVQDDLEVAGTYDNIYRLTAPTTPPDGQTLPAGTLLVGDKKTGQTIDFGHGSWGVQTAVYSRATKFDIATGQRVATEPVNQSWGVIAHIPAGQGFAKLYWIDLNEGWRLAQLAVEVRASRRIKTMVAADLTPPTVTVSPLLERARTAATIDELNALYFTAKRAGAWNDELLDACAVRKRELTQTPATT